jgi:hypothetical protein
MAHRKKSKSKKHSRRRRIGATGGRLQGDAMQVVGVVAGSVAATVMQRSLSSLDPKVVSAGQLVGGFLIKNNAKTPLMEGIGWGVLGAGAIGLTHEVGLIKGIDDMVAGMMNPGMEDYYEDMGNYGGYNMRGINNSSRVAGISNGARIAGDADDSSTYNIPPMGM